MPPKPKFTREQIAEVALAIVSEEGAEALTARTLAARLDCSTRPIFTVFRDMEDLRATARRLAAERLEQRAWEALDKAEGFAQASSKVARIVLDDFNLFKMAYITGDDWEKSLNELITDESRPTHRYLCYICNTYGLSMDEAKALFHHAWIYLYGMGTLCAGGPQDLSDEELKRTLESDYEAVHSFMVARDRIGCGKDTTG